MERIRQAFEKYISPQKIYFPTKMDSVSEMYANYYKYMLPYLIWLITNMYDTILVEKKNDNLTVLQQMHQQNKTDNDKLHLLRKF